MRDVIREWKEMTSCERCHMLRVYFVGRLLTSGRMLPSLGLYTSS